MKNLNQYAQDFNKIVKDYALEVRAAHDRVSVAADRLEDEKRKDPSWSGYRYLAAKAEHEKELAALHDVQNGGVDDALRKVAKLRGELEAAAGETMAANPADMDGATMELLNHADILTAADYERLYNNAESVTMKRLIADAAGKKAAGITEANDPERVKLRMIENVGRGYTAAGYLRKYDELTDAFKRGIRNNHILDRWDELTGDFISQF